MGKQARVGAGKKQQTGTQAWKHRQEQTCKQAGCGEGQAGKQTHEGVSYMGRQAAHANRDRQAEREREASS